MNKRLITVGILLTLVWGCVAAVSIGIPTGICEAVNSLTGGLLSDAVGNMHNGFYYDVHNKDMPTVIFLILFSAAFLLYFFTILKLPKKEPCKHGFVLILFFAVIFRLVLVFSVPVHENDVYRYLWDGKVFFNGTNPYKFPPGDLESLSSGEDRDYYNPETHTVVKAKIFSPEQEKEIEKLEKIRQEAPVDFNRIGHRTVATIYPPAAQFIFGFSQMVRPGSIEFIKMIFMIFDIFSIVIIALILKMTGKNPVYAVVYAWSPLVLKEFANSAHYDAVPIFFMMLSVYFVLKAEKVKGAISLAVAGLAKFFPLVLGVVYARKLKLKNILLCASIFTAVYIPFFLWGGTGIRGVFQGLARYSAEWEYNGSIFVLVNAVIGMFLTDKTIVFVLAKIIVASMAFILMIVLALKKGTDNKMLLQKAFFMMAVIFLLSPVGDPWYYCWVIPFLCFLPYRSFILLSGLLIFSYLTFNHKFGMVFLGTFRLPVINMIQYVPFFIVLAIEMAMGRKKKVQYA